MRNPVVATLGSCAPKRGKDIGETSSIYHGGIYVLQYPIQPDVSRGEPKNLFVLGCVCISASGFAS